MKHYLSKIIFFVLFFVISYSLISFQSSPEGDTKEKSNRFVVLICAANNDENQVIKNGVEKNIESINQIAKMYAHYLNKKYIVHTFIDENFKRIKLMNAIEEDNILQKGDIVLFYYVGHGKSAKSETEKRPLLIFDGKDKFCPNINAIHSTIKQKVGKQNTVISIAETCNAKINSTIATTQNKDILSIAGEESQVDENVRKAIQDIFKQDKIIYSARRGDKAYIYNNGGVFMNVFKNYMQKSSLDLYVRKYPNENVSSHIFKSIKQKVESTSITDTYDNILPSQTLGYE